MNDLLQDKKDELASKGMTYLTVKVIPKSSRNEIIEVMDNETIKIRICAPAEKGKANKELCKFLNKTFEAQTTIISGKNDRTKLIKISHA